MKFCHSRSSSIVCARIWTRAVRENAAQRSAPLYWVFTRLHLLPSPRRPSQHPTFSPEDECDLCTSLPTPTHLFVPLLLTSCELHSWPPCSAPAAHPGTWHWEGWFNKSIWWTAFGLKCYKLTRVGIGKTFFFVLGRSLMISYILWLFQDLG